MCADCSTGAHRVDLAADRVDHSPVAEYALVTMVMASLAVALTSIAEPRLGTGLPVTVARAQALATKTAKANGVAAADARQTFASAPYARAALRYLYTTGWIAGRKAPAECVFAKATTGATEQRLRAEIRTSAKLVARLRRMGVTVAEAARAVTRGTAAAC